MCHYHLDHLGTPQEMTDDRDEVEPDHPHVDVKGPPGTSQEELGNKLAKTKEQWKLVSPCE